MTEVSDRLFLGRIVPGMDVCDVTGEKVGSIAHIYHHDEATDGTTPVRSDDLIEVKSGFLGLGKHYYIPMGSVQEVLRLVQTVSGSATPPGAVSGDSL